MPTPTGSVTPVCHLPPNPFLQDYRWMEYPARGRVVQHPGCQAVQTYRGHAVLSTLIRCEGCGQGLRGGGRAAREVDTYRGCAVLSVRIRCVGNMSCFSRARCVLQQAPSHTSNTLACPPMTCPHIAPLIAPRIPPPRSYWSPAATTGQRYIYTGSYDGRVHVYGERPWATMQPWHLGSAIAARPASQA